MFRPSAEVWQEKNERADKNPRYSAAFTAQTCKQWVPSLLEPLYTHPSHCKSLCSKDWRCVSSAACISRWNASTCAASTRFLSAPQLDSFNPRLCCCDSRYSSLNHLKSDTDLYKLTELPWGGRCLRVLRNQQQQQTSGILFSFLACSLIRATTSHTVVA